MLRYKASLLYVLACGVRLSDESFCVLLCCFDRIWVDARDLCAVDVRIMGVVKGLDFRFLYVRLLSAL